MSIAALPLGDEGCLAYRVHDFAYVHGLKQRLCTSLSTAANIGNSLHSILPAQCQSSYDHNPTKNAATWTRPLRPWTQSLSLGATMSNHSIHDMRRPRRNTVSEIPFAGRIGGFQQEIADDEKNREILKSQPDAVCTFPPSLCLMVTRKGIWQTDRARLRSTQSATHSIPQASWSSITGKWL